MADVFISYARPDRAKAALVAKALEFAGFSVWWDREILPHQGFRKVIEAELTSSKAVLVLWSRTSVHSDFVIDEAATAASLKKLIQASIESSDAPLGFRQGQIADLCRALDASDEGFRSILASVTYLVGNLPTAPLMATTSKYRTTIRRSIGGSIVLAALVSIGASSDLRVSLPQRSSTSNTLIQNDCDHVPVLVTTPETAKDTNDAKTVSSAVTLCDTLAGHHLDLTLPSDVKGQTFPQLMDNPKPAIAACRAAINLQPKDSYVIARMHFNLARALNADQQSGFMDHYRIAAYMGSRRSQMSLGLRFVEGDSTEQSFVTARCYFIAADRNGDTTAKEVLARFAELGIGEPIDKGKAERIMRKSAELGYARSNYNYATLLLEKDGEEVKRKALQHLEAAILNGDEKGPYALTQLGWMYEKGIGTDRDREKARDFYDRALKQQHKLAAVALAKITLTDTLQPTRNMEARRLLEQGLHWKSNALDRDAPWIYRRNKDFEALLAEAVERIRDVAIKTENASLGFLAIELDEQYKGGRLTDSPKYLCSNPLDVPNLPLCIGYDARH